METKALTGKTSRDIILVLDTSGSMGSKSNGRQKLAQLQEDIKDLIQFLLTEEGTRVAVIGFHSEAYLVSELTSNKTKLIDAIDGLTPSGNTNYKKAYQKVIDLLSGYEEVKDRDLVMLFLTDGQASAASAEYQVLKDSYNIIICGIQYELGSSIKKSIINSSDVQYAANTINLKSIFFESIGVEEYEEFEITDYITEEFVVEDISDIRVSRGEVKLETDSSGKQKVIWKLPTSEAKFITSFHASMEIDVTYQGEVKPDKVIATNEKVEVKTKLSGEKTKKKESEETPEIRGGYYVTYDPNLPRECNPDGKDMTIIKAYFPYERVDKISNDNTCNGWQFKEWESNKDIPLVEDNQFIMPSEDVIIKALWTKMDISKTMEGTIYDVPKKDLLEAIKENAGTSISLDTGFVFGKESSASNGRGLYLRSGTENNNNPIYYYRGAVENNNVLFAGICWQIVRTTETGGIKLIYNGVSSDGRTCKNTGNSHIGTSQFYSKNNSLAYVGYMRGVNETIDEKKYEYMGPLLQSNCIKAGSSITYSNGRYKILNPSHYDFFSPEYPYFCETCSGKQAWYALRSKYYFDGSYGRYAGVYALELTDGATLEDVKEEMFDNKYDSDVKKVIDNWYKTNIDDKGYTKYLDDNTVWCNSRVFDNLILDGVVYNVRFDTYTRITVNTDIDTINTRKLLLDTEACSRVEDRFTTKNASVGNKALKYPVGMLTVDEVILAGMQYRSPSDSKDSYLNTDYRYWTMSPCGYNTNTEKVELQIFVVTEVGRVGVKNATPQIQDVINFNYIRPSITLKSGTKVYITDADGTVDHPYEVVVE